MVMLAARILALVLVATVSCELSCRQQDAATTPDTPDDVTSLLQNQAELKTGAERSSTDAVDEKKDLQALAHDPEEKDHKDHEHKLPHEHKRPGSGHHRPAPAHRRKAIHRKRQTGDDIHMITFGHAVFDPTTVHDTALLGLAEFLGTCFIVFLGVGSIMSLENTGGKTVEVSLAFAFTIASVSYALGHYSGGQFNFAVTFALMLISHITLWQCFVILVCQMLGATCGALCAMAVFPLHADKSFDAKTGAGGIAVNFVRTGYTEKQALIGEALCTLLVVYVFLETQITPATVANRALACVAIGFAYFAAHSLLIPIDGCSVNPSRSFGSYFAKKQFRHDNPYMFESPVNTSFIVEHWIFWAGPLLGATGAAAVYYIMHHELVGSPLQVRHS